VVADATPTTTKIRQPASAATAAGQRKRTFDPFR
jgi:hypothetical protein